jgi:hypothetical protein
MRAESAAGPDMWHDNVGLLGRHDRLAIDL